MFLGARESECHSFLVFSRSTTAKSSKTGHKACCNNPPRNAPNSIDMHTRGSVTPPPTESPPARQAPDTQAQEIIVQARISGEFRRLAGHCGSRLYEENAGIHGSDGMQDASLQPQMAENSRVASKLVKMGEFEWIWAWKCRKFGVSGVFDGKIAVRRGVNRAVDRNSDSHSFGNSLNLNEMLAI
jgi:hypothetical protein